MSDPDSRPLLQSYRSKYSQFVEQEEDEQRSINSFEDEGDFTPALMVFDSHSSSHRSSLQPLSEDTQTSGFFFTIFNLWNDVLTSGVVAIPYYVLSMGIYVSPFLFVFFGMLTVYTLNVLYSMATKHKQSTYPLLCLYGLGKTGYILICIFMFIFNFGGLVSNLIIVGDNVPQLIHYFVGSTSEYLTRKYVLLYATIIFMPLSFSQSISKFAITSFFSITSVLCMCALLFFHSVLKHSEYPQPPHALDPRFDFVKFMSAIGGISYLFVCHDLAFNVFTSFKGATHKRWSAVTHITILLTIIVFCLVGYSGYFMFFENLDANVLENFSYKNVFANVARTFLSLTILLSVPYSAFMPRISLYAILTLLLDKGDHKQNIIQRHRSSFNIITTVVVLGGSLVLSEVVTDLGITISLVGAVSAVSIAFVFPPLIFLALEKDCTTTQKWVNVTVLAIGIVSAIISTGSVIYDALT